jgi:TolB-like protein
MEDSAGIENRRVGARRTLTALLITVSALFAGSILFMVVRGDNSAPQGRRVLAVLPVRASGPEAGSGRYAGFGEGLAAYFGRADPNDLGVFGPASTSEQMESGGDPLAVGRAFDADLILIGHEIAGTPAATLVAELLRVDDGSTLWRGEFEVPLDLDRRELLFRVATEVTEVLDLPR